MREDKTAARKRCRMLRDALSPAERALADDAIKRRLIATEAFERSDVVLTYLSFGSEVNTRSIVEHCWRIGKRVALPRCVPQSRLMTWHIVESLEELEQNSYGIEEPNPAIHETVILDVCTSDSIALVPALAFDREGFRLGYGGGYYDEFLSNFPGVSIGLCRKVMLSDGPLPREPHDVPVCLVITEKTY